MKNTLLFVLLSSTLLFGCQSTDDQKLPQQTSTITDTSTSFEQQSLPTLHFKIGEKEINTFKGIYTWSAIDRQTGESMAIKAQTLPPFEIVNIENSIPVNLAENSILTFEPAPLRYEINIWHEGKIISTYSSFEDIREKGNYIVEIVGYWNEGRVTYVCALNIL